MNKNIANLLDQLEEHFDKMKLEENMWKASYNFGQSGRAAWHKKKIVEISSNLAILWKNEKS